MTEESMLSLLFFLSNYLHWRLIHSQPHKNTHPVICDFTDNETFLAHKEVHGFHW